MVSQGTIRGSRTSQINQVNQAKKGPPGPSVCWNESRVHKLCCRSLQLFAAASPFNLHRHVEVREAMPSLKFACLVEAPRGKVWVGDLKQKVVRLHCIAASEYCGQVDTDDKVEEWMRARFWEGE